MNSYVVISLKKKKRRRRCQPGKTRRRILWRVDSMFSGFQAEACLVGVRHEGWLM